jgi:hypothetical protein
MRGLQGIQGERGGLREGFYGTITFKNEITTDYLYNYNLKYKNLPVTTGTFTNALQSINYTIGEDSNDRLLRPYYEYNVEYFRNSASIQNIEFSISGGKYRRNANIFYFTPNNNCINEGTLIIRSKVLPYSGNVVFTRTSGEGSQVVSLKTDISFIADQVVYTEYNDFLVSLPTLESYLDVCLQTQAYDYWVMSGEGFRQNVGAFTIVQADNRSWRRYVIGNYQGTLNYDFSTFYDGY